MSNIKEETWGPRDGLAVKCLLSNYEEKNVNPRNHEINQGPHTHYDPISTVDEDSRIGVTGKVC